MQRRQRGFFTSLSSLSEEGDNFESNIGIIIIIIYDEFATTSTGEEEEEEDLSVIEFHNTITTCTITTDTTE